MSVCKENTDLDTSELSQLDDCHLVKREHSLSSLLIHTHNKCNELPHFLGFVFGLVISYRMTCITTLQVLTEIA